MSKVIDKQFLEEHLASLERGLDKASRTVKANEGAIEFCQLLLKFLEVPDSPPKLSSGEQP